MEPFDLSTGEIDFVHTAAAQPYGDAAIAAMGVVQRITMFGASTMLGFGSSINANTVFLFSLYKA